MGGLDGSIDLDRAPEIVGADDQAPAQ